MYQAYRQLAKNQGSAGVDGMDVRTLGRELDKAVMQLSANIQTRNYEAQPILGVRTALPKTNSFI